MIATYLTPGADERKWSWEILSLSRKGVGDWAIEGDWATVGDRVGDWETWPLRETGSTHEGVYNSGKMGYVLGEGKGGMVGDGDTSPLERECDEKCLKREGI